MCLDCCELSLFFAMPMLSVCQFWLGLLKHHVCPPVQRCLAPLPTQQPPFTLMASCIHSIPLCPCVVCVPFQLHSLFCCARSQMPGTSPYTAASFHPDGLLLVTGTADAKAQIWEMRQQKAVTGFEAGAPSRLPIADNRECFSVLIA